MQRYLYKIEFKDPQPKNPVMIIAESAESVFDYLKPVGIEKNRIAFITLLRGVPEEEFNRYTRESKPLHGA